MTHHPVVPTLSLAARYARRAGLLLCLTTAGTALAQAPRPAAAAAQIAQTQIHGCVIDADDYSPRSLPIRVFLHDGTSLTTVQSDAAGRFSALVPEGTYIYTMTPSGNRSTHSTAWVTARGPEVHVPGCLMHFN